MGFPKRSNQLLVIAFGFSKGPSFEHHGGEAVLGGVVLGSVYPVGCVRSRALRGGMLRAGLDDIRIRIIVAHFSSPFLLFSSLTTPSRPSPKDFQLHKY